LIRRLGKTPPFRGPDGEITSDSIAEIAYRQLGGLDQWVMIRGESVANPPLILLHGVPGWSETGFFRSFKRAAGEELHRRVLGSARRRQVV
jgi:pimeloyl-ACP methyl ester carboxylesterase